MGLAPDSGLFMPDRIPAFSKDEIGDMGGKTFPQVAFAVLTKFLENEINQTVKGSGLGLSLVKNIIEAHKGAIWITSKVNEGTTVHFTLPLKES